MQVIKDKKSLEGAIRQLESRRVMQADSLREHWEHTREELNPMHILKDEMRESFTSGDLGGQVFKGVFSLVSGIITKKLIVGSSDSSFKSIIGTIAQTGATSMVYKNTDEMTTKGASLLSSFLKKMKI